MNKEVTTTVTPEDKQKEIREARAAYMREYRKTDKGKEAIKRSNENYWYKKAQEMRGK